MLLIAALLAAAVPACDPNGTQMQLDACAAADFARADAGLNAQWRRTLARGRQSGAADLLLRAQRAWLAFRDAECAAEEAGSVGGSIHSMAVTQCRATLTRARTRQLAQILSQG